MNNLPPIASPTGAPTPLLSASGVDLSALAQAQKWVLWGVVANIGAVALTLATQALSPTHPTPISAVLIILLLVIRLMIAIGVALATWHLARTLQYRWAFLPVIFSFLPLLGLITLLVLNSRATTKLREGGYEVGLLGAKPRRTG